MRRKLLSLLLLLMTAATGAWAAIGGSGTQGDPYTISSAADWNEFCTSFDTKTYAGQYVTLTCNIPTAAEVGAGIKVTKMAAETYQGNYFKGTFDGGGYTITVDLGSDWEHYTCGLFRYLDGATIKNLKVDGTVLAHGWKWRGGFAGVTYGNCIFENCTSKVTIDAGDYMNNHSSGGFVGYAKGDITFTNCVFWGKLLGAYATNWGGFVGQKDNDDYKVTLNKCLFYPTEVTASATGSATFVRTDDADGIIMGTDDNSAYCTRFLGTQQGTLASTTEPTAENGIYKSTSVNGQSCFVVATVSGIEDEYIADGYEHTLTPVLTCMGTTLTENTDYTIATGSNLTYSGTGNYSVTFNAAGSYSGSCIVNYKVVNPSGSCGTGVTWTLTSDGVLTISGTGAMTNYDSYTEIPWFSYRNNITNVVIESGVTTIGKGAFYSCNNLESVSIPATVTSIGEEAFAECGPSTGMTVAIAEGSALGTIGAKAFLFSNLVSITLPSSLTTISSSAFYYCGKLTSITIPASVTSIGSDAFNHCSSLVSVYVMATTPPTLCNNYAFSNAASGLKIYVPADYGDTYKTEWPAYASIIEELTASGYCGDPSVNDGKNVVWTLTSGGVLTISGTGAMKNYGDSNEVPWYSYSNIGSITSVVIENGVTAIGEFALSACKNLASVSIPASVTSIGDDAFYGSGTSAAALTVIIAEGSTLTTIGTAAFYGCTKLTSFSIPASVKSIGENTFIGCDDHATITLHSNPSIIYPAFPDNAAVAMYLTAHEGKTNEYWTTFYNQDYRFVADVNTQVFKVTLSGDKLTMHEVEDKITQEMSGYVLKTTGGNPVMTLTKEATSNNVTSHLQGVAVAEGTTSDGTMYVLSNGSQGVGFYRLKSGKTLGVGKAYLTYIGGSSTRGFLGFGDTTSINDVRCQKEDVRGEYYDLQGRRVSQPTKGLYIVNGKKVVIK